MNSILESLNNFNQNYILKIYQEEKIQDFDEELINKLSKIEKYEFILNKSPLVICRYEDLYKHFIDFGKLNIHNITFDELSDYFKDKLKTKITLDRKYFFQELLLHFCEQQQKRIYAEDTIKELKLLIESKLTNINTDYDLFLRLYVRYIILTKQFDFIDNNFIVNINNIYINNLNLKENFLETIHFFKFIFKRYDKNMYCYRDLEDAFDCFVKKAEIEILNQNENVYRKEILIAEVYEILKNYNKKTIFYQKPIDNILFKYQNLSIDNIFQIQNIIDGSLKISKKINNYKAKELKLLASKIADLISKNANKFFVNKSANESEINEALLDFFYELKKGYEKSKNKEEKIDYLVFYFFHDLYKEERFNNWCKDNEKSNFITSLFCMSYTNFKGYSYNVKDTKRFKFFNQNSCIINHLLFNLDIDTRWVDYTADVILQDIKTLNIISHHEKQYEKAINNFKDEQYIEFMYIAPALIENILKKFLHNIEGEFLSFRDNGLIEKTLNQIIEELINNSDCYMDKNILRYISYILVDNHGPNLRNEILHGNFNDNLFSKYNAMFIYIILIYLIRYFKNDQD